MPVVQRDRKRTDDEQGWGMLAFESLSAGACAVLLVLVLALGLVGIYDYCVWPWTKWDLGDVDVEKWSLWLECALAFIFVSGTVLGFWCFSGWAFREKAGPRRDTSPARSR